MLYTGTISSEGRHVHVPEALRAKRGAALVVEPWLAEAEGCRREYLGSCCYRGRLRDNGHDKISVQHRVQNRSGRKCNTTWGDQPIFIVDLEARPDSWRWGSSDSISGSSAMVRCSIRGVSGMVSQAASIHEHTMRIRACAAREVSEGDGRKGNVVRG